MAGVRGGPARHPPPLPALHVGDVLPGRDVSRERERLARRNSVTVDWDDAWTLEKATLGASEANVVEISVRFTLRIPVKVTALLSVGLDVSRSEVRRLVADGSQSSAHCLTGTASGDFSFALRR